MEESPQRYYLILLVAMVFWGGSWVSAKIVVGIAPPMTIGFFRFLIGGVLFFVLLAFTSRRPLGFFSRENIPVLLLVGLTGIYGYGVLFLNGMTLTTAAQGAIIAGFNPVTVSIFAHLIHKERLERRWQYIGYISAFVGVIFVVGIQALLDFRIEYLLGNIIILGAMVTWGLYSSVGKEAMKRMSPLEVNAGGALFGTILFGVGAVYEGFWALPAMIDPVFWVNVLYLGVFVTFVGFLFYFIGIKNIGASQSGGFINLVPVFGVLLSAIVLPGEPIYWTFMVGLLLVILGISLVNFPQRSSGSSPKTQET